MAVTQLSAYEYVGLAADTKPTTSVIKGARFIETDTGAESAFNGTAWVDVSPKTRA